MNTKIMWNLFLYISIIITTTLCNGQKTTPPGRVMLYDYQLDIGESRQLCPSKNFLCSDNTIHYLCNSKHVSPCRSFKKINMAADDKRRILLGHNGLRNKIAYKWNIANMNIVHWSYDLEIMANEFLEKCSTKRDPCLIIGTNQLYTNHNACNFDRLRKLWPNEVVRVWFREMGMHTPTFEDFFTMYENGRMKNFAQMMWPNLEFLGCGAARFHEAYHAICFYWPSLYEYSNKSVFSFGKPCTNCSYKREICSRNFIGLCGLDIDISGSYSVNIIDPTLDICCLLCCCAAYYIMQRRHNAFIYWRGPVCIQSATFLYFILH